MDRKEVKNICALSPVQEGMYFHYLMSRENDPYFMQFQYDLTGTVDEERLHRTVESIVDRHDTFRTLFLHRQTPDPVQVILKKRDLPFQSEDLSGLTDEEQSGIIESFLSDDRKKGFDLATDSLLRFAVFRLSDKKVRLVMSIHHIIIDGWSGSILEEELYTGYVEQKSTTADIRPTAPSFTEYIRWLKRQPKEEGVKFWTDRLQESASTAPFTANRTDSGEKGLVREDLVIPAEQVKELKKQAAQYRVSFSGYLRAVWSITAAAYTGSRSFYSLNTVSGRPAELPEINQMVGMFINAVISHNDLGRSTFSDFANQQHHEFLESYPYHHVSLTDIKKATGSQKEFSDHLLVFENYPEMGDRRGELEKATGFKIDVLSSEESTNYPVTVQFQDMGSVTVRIFMKKRWFDQADLDRLISTTEAVVEAVCSDPTQPVHQLITSVTPETPSETKKPVSLHVTSTFTDAPLEPYLTWWLEKSGFQPSLELAEYNQLFQELSDPDSNFSGRTGPGLILVKCSDLIRYQPSGEAENETVLLKEQLETLKSLVRKQAVEYPVLVGITPDPPKSVSREGQLLLEEFTESLKETAGVSVLDLRAPLIPLVDLFDPIRDEMGHVPYTEAWFAWAASRIARRVFSWKQSVFKVIAVDADNTLWSGVLGEDGVNGISFEAEHLFLQQFLVDRVREGFLLVLCSKNNENEVRDLFDSRSEMLLSRDHFVDFRVNWQPKSENLKELASELNLGIDSFIFIDDSPHEIHEVGSALPEVLTLQLPENGDQWAAWFGINWAFDIFTVTDEDASRTGMYRAERKRKSEEKESGDGFDFISSLDIRTLLRPVGTALLERVVQITQRTNQFNLNGARRTLSEIRTRAASSDSEVVTITVKDRFGDYGTSGALFLMYSKHLLEVDGLMLSCRVLGRGVEEHILAFLRDRMSERNIDTLRLHHKNTGRNTPFRQFLQKYGFRPLSEDPAAGMPVEMPVELTLQELNKISYHGNYRYELNGADSVTELSPETTVENSVRSANTTDSRQTESIAVLQTESSNLPASTGRQPAWPDTPTDHLHQIFYEALRRNSADRLMQCRPAQAEKVRNKRPYQAPRTPMELEISLMWNRILGTSETGRLDDFFENGGNSLLATQFASLVHRKLGLDMELRLLFDHSVLHELASRLENTDQEFQNAVIAAEERESYPLTGSQERIWRSEQIFEEDLSYHLGGAYRIRGPLDTGALEQAFQLLSLRHAALRTTFHTEDEQPVQKVHAKLPVTFIRETVSSDTPETDSGDWLKHRFERFFKEPFHFENGPLIQVLCLTEGKDSTVVGIKIHHLVTDGWSHGILMRELSEIYRSVLTGGEAVLPELPVTFTDYVLWSQSGEQAEKKAANRSFWRDELSNPGERLQLPADFPRPKVVKQQTKRVTIEMGDSVRNEIDRCAQSHGLSLYMMLMASVHILLGRYSGQNDVTVGSPVAGRMHPDLENIIGFFVNVLPVRTETAAEETLSRYLEKVRSKVISILQHQEISLDELLEESGQETGSDRSPLFDVLLLVQNEVETDAAFQELEVEALDQQYIGGGYDLVFQSFSQDSSWKLQLEYQPEIFHERTMRLMGAHWAALLRNMARADDSTPIHEISIYDENLTERVEAMGRGAEISHPDISMPDLFSRYASLTPSKTVYLDEDGPAVTYSEMEMRSDAVAHHLLSRGIGRGENVIVSLRRTRDLLPVMLGIMKTGAVYVPVDGSTPHERVAYILQDADAAFWIRDTGEDIETDENYGPNIPLPDNTISGRNGRGGTGIKNSNEAEIISVHELLKPASDLTIQAKTPLETGDTAYIIYTSGSTGKPKGVEVTHRGFVNMIHSQVRVCDVHAADRLLCFASIGFDASLAEMFLGLCAGATLVGLPEKCKKDANAFLTYIDRTKITVMTLPPVFLSALGQADLKHTRILITAGEAARKNDVLHYANRLRYVNAYGPTECSVCASMFVVEPSAEYGGSIPIGKPVDNLQLMILDRWNRPAPIGAVGQLAVAGPGLARGYYQRPELTENAFIKPADNRWPRMYLTGDHVKWNAMGVLEFAGRKDNQVKVRGYRIELEEIEYQFEQHKDVNQACVIVRKAPDGSGFLTAYLVCSGEMNETDILTSLETKLPPYMIPNVLLQVKELELNQNGKVDRKKLPDPLAGLAGSRTSRRRQTEKENNPNIRLLYEAVERFLELKNPDYGRSFVMLGGDSIRAIRITNFLRQQGIPVKAGMLYEAESIDRLAKSPIFAAAALTSPAVEGSRQRESGEIPLTPVQDWFLQSSRDVSKRDEFWLQAAVGTSEQLPDEVVSEILHCILNRHDAFRTVFQQENGSWGARLLDKPSFFLETADVKEGVDIQDVINSHLRRFRSGINLSEGPLSALLILQEKGKTTVLITAHHLIIDITSLRIIKDELEWITGLWKQDKPLKIASGYTPVTGYQHALDAYLSSESGKTDLKNWHHVIKTIQGLDQHAVRNGTGRKTGAESRFSASRTAALLRTCEQKGLQLRDLLLAAAVSALQETLHLPKISAGIETQGRKSPDPSADLSSTVGWFTSEYPLLFGDAAGLDEILETIESGVESVKFDGIGYGLARKRILRDGGKVPSPMIGYNFLGDLGSPAAGEVWQWSNEIIPERGENSEIRHPYEISAYLEEGCLFMRMDFAGLFAAPEPDHAIRRVEELLGTWLQENSPEEKKQLVCMPFLASNAGLFQTLKQRLNSDVETVILELPGHGGRMDEPVCESLEEVVSDLVKQIKKQVYDLKNSVWLGHSMGAWLACACLEKMEAEGYEQPRHLVISDVEPPSTDYNQVQDHFSDDEKQSFYKVLGYDVWLQGLEEDAKEHVESLILADIRVMNEFKNEALHILRVPATFLCSEQTDEETAKNWLSGWRRLSTKTIESGLFKGGHLDWLDNESNAELIGDLVSKSVTKLKTGES